MFKREFRMSFKPATLLLTAAKVGVVCLAAGAAIPLAGCVTDPLATGSITGDDYHQRHPIVMAQAPTSLDIFPVGDGALDQASVDSIRAFAARYKEYGTSRIVILSPLGADRRARMAVGEIRRVLASSSASVRRSR